MSPSQSTRSKPRSTFTSEQTVLLPLLDLAKLIQQTFLVICARLQTNMLCIAFYSATLCKALGALKLTNLCALFLFSLKSYNILNSLSRQPVYLYTYCEWIKKSINSVAIVLVLMLAVWGEFITSTSHTQFPCSTSPLILRLLRLIPAYNII